MDIKICKSDCVSFCLYVIFCFIVTISFVAKSYCLIFTPIYMNPEISRLLTNLWLPFLFLDPVFSLPRRSDSLSRSSTAGLFPLCALVKKIQHTQDDQTNLGFIKILWVDRNVFLDYSPHSVYNVLGLSRCDQRTFFHFLLHVDREFVKTILSTELMGCHCF